MKSLFKKTLSFSKALIVFYFLFLSSLTIQAAESCHSFYSRFDFESAGLNSNKLTTLKSLIAQMELRVDSGNYPALKVEALSYVRKSAHVADLQDFHAQQLYENNWILLAQRAKQKYHESAAELILSNPLSKETIFRTLENWSTNLRSQTGLDLSMKENVVRSALIQTIKNSDITAISEADAIQIVKIYLLKAERDLMLRESASSDTPRLAWLNSQIQELISSLTYELKISFETLRLSKTDTCCQRSCLTCAYSRGLKKIIDKDDGPSLNAHLKLIPDEPIPSQLADFFETVEKLKLLFPKVNW